MTAHGRQGYREVQTSTFQDLVEKGVYGGEFQHPPETQEFFRECLTHALELAGGGAEPSILDCGCGPGAWLEVLARSDGALGKAHLYGFDLTPAMVEVARPRLEQIVPDCSLRTGDILDDASYAFDSEAQQYHIIYAYDVIQQIPREGQFDACTAMLRRLAPGGCAVIFDHDRRSFHGYLMGVLKFVTQYLHIPLVPRYYCNAHYPPLSVFAKRIAAVGAYTTEIKLDPVGRKRALIVRSLADPAQRSLERS